MDIGKNGKYLFEVIVDTLTRANKKYNVVIPWYIMTSRENNKDTVEFLEEKDYFGYPKEYTYIFEQGELPLITEQGKLILNRQGLIKEASNGNGDVFASMKADGILDDIYNKKIEWLSFSGVDNVILEIVDSLFLGLTIHNNKLIASKTLFKENADDKDWIFARKNGKPAIINSCHLTDSMKIAKNADGKYLYRQMNMLAHLFHVSAIDKICNTKLPYHRAFKKNTFINDEGMKQVPETPNTFKFETFIFDAFSLFNDIELLQVEVEDEFAPIKDFAGPHNPEVAKELYEKKHEILKMTH